MTTSMGRPSKGDRDQFLPKVPRALADLVRRNADAIRVHHGEYIASVLAEQFAMPWLAPVETRSPVLGRLQELLDEAGVGVWDRQPSAGWSAVDLFTTRPARPIGDLIRSRSKLQGMTFSEYIVAILMAWHGMTREADPALAPRLTYRREDMRLPA